MAGGDGNDTYFIDNAMDLVVVLADQGSSDLIVSSTSGLTLSAQIENLMLSGSATLGTGNSLDNLLSANVLLGSTLYGGGGEDTFVGGAGNDWFIIDSSGDSVEGGDDDLAVETSTKARAGESSAAMTAVVVVVVAAELAVAVAWLLVMALEAAGYRWWWRWR